MKRQRKKFAWFMLMLIFMIIIIFGCLYFCDLFPVQNRLKETAPFDMDLLDEQAERNGLNLSLECADGYNVYIDYNEPWADKRSDISYAFYGASEQTKGAFQILEFLDTQEAVDWLCLFNDNYNRGIFFKSYTNQNGVFVQFNYLFEYTDKFTIYKVCYVQIDNVVIVSSQEDRSICPPKIGRTICEVLKTQETK